MFILQRLYLLYKGPLPKTCDKGQKGELLCLTLDCLRFLFHFSLFYQEHSVLNGTDLYNALTVYADSIIVKPWYNDDRGLEATLERICRIQLSDDYESDRSELGNDLLSLAESRKENQKLDGTIRCYELILENFDEYEDSMEKTREEIGAVLGELKKLKTK